MTRWLAAYDAEMSGLRKPRPDVPSCIEACRRIVEVHRRHGMPATFFIVGNVLEEAPEELRSLLDGPRFDPGMRMPELTFRYVRERGLEPCTFGCYDDSLRACTGSAGTDAAAEHLNGVRRAGSCPARRSAAHV